MKTLVGEERELFIGMRVNQIAATIMRDRPRSLSTQDMDLDVRQLLIVQLNLLLILTDWDGRRIRLSYLPTEEE